MANEIKARYLSAQTLYAILIRGVDGQVWNGSAFEAVNNSNWASYAITLTEQFTTGVYFGNMPVVAQGLYDAWAFAKIGITPDAADNLVGQASLDWGGAAELGINSIIDLIGVGAGSVIIDHNYGGLDNLAYQTASGAGIINAEISIFLSSDYDAGRTSNNYVVARTATKEMGRWLRALALFPDNYTILAVKPGEYGPDIMTVTVS